MTDVFDQATEREEDFRDDALKAQQRRAEGHGVNPGKTVEDSARFCVVCDAKIPEGRRRAIPGVETCTGCETDLERALKGYARTRF